MSFNPITDSATVLRIDHQSSYFSDTGATVPAVSSGPVQSIKDSTGTFTAVLASTSDVVPTLGAANAQPIVSASPSGGGFSFTLGQNSTLVNLINNAIATLSTQTGTNFLTMLVGVACSSGTVLLSKSTSVQLIEFISGTGIGTGGSSVDTLPRTLNGILPHQVGMVWGPVLNVGNASINSRLYCDGTGTKTGAGTLYATDTSTDIIIGGVAPTASPPINGAYQIAGNLYYVVLLNRALAAHEMAEAEVFYRSIYGMSDPRAGQPYNLAMVGNSFYEQATPLVETLATTLSLPPQSLYNLGYGGQSTSEINATSYPAETDPLLTFLASTGKPTVVFLQEITNDLVGAFTGAQLAAHVQTFWQTCRSNFPAFPVVFSTCLPRGGSSEVHNPERNACNADLPALVAGVSGVYLADIAASPVMGQDGDSANTTYYGDGVHPTQAGCDIIAGIEGPVIVTASTFSGGALAAGAATFVSAGNKIASVTVATASGGTSPYTYQWYRSLTNGFIPNPLNKVAGATSQTLNDTGLTNGVTYYYVNVVTDSASATAKSNQVSATPVGTPLILSQAIMAVAVLGRSIGVPFANTNQTGVYINSRTNQLVIPLTSGNATLGSNLVSSQDGTYVYIGLNSGDPSSGA